MVAAARTSSQLLTHMSIAFIISYAVSGSLSFGGLVALLEPMCNVALLPLHQRLWRYAGAGADRQRQYRIRTLEKLSQLGLHMGVALLLMTWMSGSLVLGGMVVAAEAAANVLLLPVHDRLWKNIGQQPKHSCAIGAF